MTTRLTLTEPRTDPELLALIQKAKAHVMTPEEFEAQRISWVIGQMGMTHPEWTREETEARVREALRLPPAGTPTRAELEAEVARLREWCSAAADDLAGLLAAMKAGVGGRFDDIFRSTAEELAETSAFLRAAAEGRADGTLYDAEITKVKSERDAARQALAATHQALDDMAQNRSTLQRHFDEAAGKCVELQARLAVVEAALTPFADAARGRDGWPPEMQIGGSALTNADLFRALAALPLPTADCPLPRSEGALSP